MATARRGGYPQLVADIRRPARTAPRPVFRHSEDKTWTLVAHFGGAAGALVGVGPLGFVAPLIA